MRILEVRNFQELAQKIWASFELPQRMSKIHNVENYYLTPLVPKCLCQKDFLLPSDPKFPCQDIRELKKTEAYAQALQYWAEKSNPPMPGQPHLLVGCIIELREMMELYVSFFDDTILDGVAPPEGFLKDWAQITVPGSAQLASTDAPIKEAAIEEAAPIGGLLRNQLLPRYHVRSR